MEKKAREIALALAKAPFVYVFSHIDADGLTAAGIAGTALRRAGISHSIHFLKRIDDDALALIRKTAGTYEGAGTPLLWFTDLGSGALTELAGYRAVVTDHHVPQGIGTALHLNPHLYGHDGSHDISGAGVTYLVAKAMDARNVDLAPLAIVGAVGDLQDSATCALTGMNRAILDDGRSAGVLDAGVDIRYFGRETRPLFKLFEFSSDPFIPGITGNNERCLQFLREHGIENRDGDDWVRWVDLPDEDKQALISSVVCLLLSRGFGHAKTSRIVGEAYTLLGEARGTPLRDAKEFATLLNSTARYGHHDVGLAICLGDRGDYYEKALALLVNHRSNLAQSIDILLDKGVIEREFLQYVNAGDAINDTIVGIVANMMLGSGSIRRDLPIIAFADSDEGMVKVSGRADRDLIRKGLDLSQVMTNAADVVGGRGGGHNVAAGATIPAGREQDFLSAAENIIRDQITQPAKT